MTFPKETFLRECDHIGISDDETTISRDIIEEQPLPCELKVKKHDEKIQHLLVQTESLENISQLLLPVVLERLQKRLTIFTIYIVISKDRPQNLDSFNMNTFLVQP
eukprot:scaffold1512_cov192-Alexandrium_tamarense.AAC.14